MTTNEINGTDVKLSKLSLTGDFDGDGIPDTIFQNNVSRLTHQVIDSLPYYDWDARVKYLFQVYADVILTVKTKRLIHYILAQDKDFTV